MYAQILTKMDCLVPASHLSTINIHNLMVSWQFPFVRSDFADMFDHLKPMKWRERKMMPHLKNTYMVKAYSCGIDLGGFFYSPVFKPKSPDFMGGGPNL